MAPIKLIQVTKQTKPQGAVSKPPDAPTNAPAQVSAITGEGAQQKTAPTFAGQGLPLKPSPPDNGSTNVINDQRQPAPRGPAPAGSNGGTGQQQGS